MRTPLFPRTASVAAALLCAAVVAGCDASTEPTSVRVGDPAASVVESGSPTVEPSDDPTATQTEATSGAPGTKTTAPTEGADDSPTQEPTREETSGSSASGRPTTYDQAQARISALEKKGVEYQQRNRFSTPGDAVYCVLASKWIKPSCELSRGFVKDADVCANALGDAVGRIEFTEQGAQPQCNTDTIREPGAPTVTAPALVARGGVSCAVEDIGVTCVDAASFTAFFLAPGDYATFG